MIKLYQQEKSIPLMRITQVIEPLEGGMLSKVDGMETFYRGVPYPHIIYALGNVKNAFKNLLKHHLTYKWLLIPFLSRKYRQKAILGLMDYCENAAHYLITPYYGYPQNPDKWCISGRELWKAGWDNPIWRIVCLVWEFDNAYRFRGQFMLSLINKEKLLLNPVKELKKVFKEMQSREVNEPMKEKWNLMLKLPYLLYIPKIREIVKEFIRKIDLNRVKLDEQDLPYVKLDTSFDYATSI